MPVCKRAGSRAPPAACRTALLRRALRAELEAPARPKDAPGPMRTKDPGGGPQPRHVWPPADVPGGPAERPGAAGGRPTNEVRIARLESIRLALLRLLEDVQAGGCSPAASAGLAAAAAGGGKS